MKFAVIGLGIGAVHADVLSRLEGAELVGVCDLDEAKTTQVAGNSGTAGFADWRDMVKRTTPDAVCVCTNPKTHLPIGEELASLGIHVLCEKPMAPTYGECIGLARACREAKVTLMIAQKKRFAPATAFVKERLEDDFGAPLSLNYRFHLGQVPRDWFWEEDDGGGPIVENSVHVFDALRYLVGEITAIRGIGGNVLNPDRTGQVDLALGLLEFECGCMGAVELGSASEWCVADEEFFLATEKAVLRWYGGFDRPSEVRYTYRETQTPESFTVDYDGAHGQRDFVAEIEHFIECVKTGREPLVTGEDAARSVACCTAMKAAVRTGERVTVEFG